MKYSFYNSKGKTRIRQGVEVAADEDWDLLSQQIVLDRNCVEHFLQLVHQHQ